MLNLFKHSYLLFLRNFKRLLIPMLLDFVTFILFGGAYSYFFFLILPHLDEISTLTGSHLTAALQSQTQESLRLALNELDVFYYHYHNILWLLLYFALTLLVIWLLCQSLSWYLTKNILKKTNLLKYLRSFTLITIIYFIAAIIMIYLLFKLLFILSFITKSIRTAPILIAVLFIILSYFLIITYSNIGKTNLKKKLFSIKTLRLYSVMFILIILLAASVTMIGKLVSNHPLAPIIVLPLVLLIFPVIAYSRICMLK